DLAPDRRRVALAPAAPGLGREDQPRDARELHAERRWPAGPARPPRRLKPTGVIGIRPAASPRHAAPATLLRAENPSQRPLFVRRGGGRPWRRPAAAALR